MLQYRSRLSVERVDKKRVNAFHFPNRFPGKLISMYEVHVQCSSLFSILYVLLLSLNDLYIIVTEEITVLIHVT